MNSRRSIRSSFSLFLTISLIPGFLLTIVLSLMPAAAASAGDRLPDAAQIARWSRAALHPDLSNTRTLEIEVRSADGSAVTWIARQARKNVAGMPSQLTVLESPASVAGIAILAEASDDSMEALWVYIPAVQRVRRMVYEGRNENFLGTDLSVQDFGFGDVHESQLTMLGQVDIGNRMTWALREVPLDTSGYSRIMTFVSTESYLPVRREYYDSQGALWKTQRYENVAIIDGIATPLRISIINHQGGGSTEVAVREVDYAAQLDDSLFRPSALPSMLKVAW